MSKVSRDILDHMLQDIANGENSIAIEYADGSRFLLEIFGARANMDGKINTYLHFKYLEGDFGAISRVGGEIDRVMEDILCSIYPGIDDLLGEVEISMEGEEYEETSPKPMFKEISRIFSGRDMSKLDAIVYLRGLANTWWKEVLQDSSPEEEEQEEEGSEEPKEIPTYIG